MGIGDLTFLFVILKKKILVSISDIVTQETTEGLVAALRNCLLEKETISGRGGTESKMKVQNITGANFLQADLSTLSLTQPQLVIMKRLQARFNVEGKRFESVFETFFFFFFFQMIGKKGRNLRNLRNLRF